MWLLKISIYASRACRYSLVLLGMSVKIPGLPGVANCDPQTGLTFALLFLSEEKVLYKTKHSHIAIQVSKKASC